MHAIYHHLCLTWTISLVFLKNLCRVCELFVEIEEPTVLGVNMFSATSLTLKPIIVTLPYWAVIQTVRFILFQVKKFRFWWRSIDIQPNEFALLAHFALFRTFGQQEPMTNKGTVYICLYLPRHALNCPSSLLLCKMHDSQVQPNLPKQGCARPIVCLIKKDTLT